MAAGTKKDHALVAFRRMKERVNRETETVRHAFKSVDVDQNGVLGRQELKYFCANENIDVRPTAMQKLRIVTLGISGGDRSRGRYATPVDFPLHDGTFIRGYAYDDGVWDLSIVQGSIFCRPVPNCLNFDFAILNLFEPSAP